MEMDLPGASATNEELAIQSVGVCAIVSATSRHGGQGEFVAAWAQRGAYTCCKIQSW
jgi:hypothetical protein